MEQELNKMRQLLKIISTLLLIFISLSSNAQETERRENSSVPTADEMKAMAQKSEAGFQAIANLVDAIDLSFLKEIDPSIKDEDITLSPEEKKKMKSKIMEGSDALQELDFKKLEKALLRLEEVIIDFDPEELFKEKTKKEPK